MALGLASTVVDEAGAGVAVAAVVAVRAGVVGNPPAPGVAVAIPAAGLDVPPESDGDPPPQAAGPASVEAAVSIRSSRRIVLPRCFVLPVFRASEGSGCEPEHKKSGHRSRDGHSSLVRSAGLAASSGEGHARSGEGDAHGAEDEPQATGAGLLHSEGRFTGVRRQRCADVHPGGHALVEVQEAEVVVGAGLGEGELELRAVRDSRAPRTPLLTMPVPSNLLPAGTDLAISRTASAPPGGMSAASAPGLPIETVCGVWTFETHSIESSTPMLTLAGDELLNVARRQVGR